MKFGEYDALVRPRALMICDTLRINDAAIAIIKAFLELGKTFAAMCHAPALLIEASAVNGRNVTSYISISTDMIDAGGGGGDHQVVADRGIITSRHPSVLDAFNAKIVEQVERGPNPVRLERPNFFCRPLLHINLPQPARTTPRPVLALPS